ncbi:hypothetical protein D3C81_1839390 [compost metagenome]
MPTRVSNSTTMAITNSVTPSALGTRKRSSSSTSGFNTMAKNTASRNGTTISAAALMPARITTSIASIIIKRSLRSLNSGMPMKIPCVILAHQSH